MVRLRDVPFKRADPVADRVLEHVRTDPGVAAPDIAAMLHEPVTTVKSALRRLEARGALTLERDGKRTLAWPTKRRAPLVALRERFR